MHLDRHRRAALPLTAALILGASCSSGGGVADAGAPDAGPTLLELGSDPVLFLGWIPHRGPGVYLVASRSHAWELYPRDDFQTFSASSYDPGFEARPDDGSATEILGMTSSIQSTEAMVRNGTGFRFTDLYRGTVLASGTLDDGPLFFESGANVIAMQKHLVFTAGPSRAWAVSELPADKGAPQIAFGRDTGDNTRQEAVVASSTTGLTFYDGTLPGDFPLRSVAIPDSAGLVAQCGYFDALKAIIVAGPTAEAAPTRVWSIEGVRATAVDPGGLPSGCLTGHVGDLGEHTLLLRTALRVKEPTGEISMHDYGGFVADAAFAGARTKRGRVALLSGTLNGRRGLTSIVY